MGYMKQTIKQWETQLLNGSSLEKAWLDAVHAYEELLTQKHGKRQRATRTWMALDNRDGDVVRCLIDTVKRRTKQQGWDELNEAEKRSIRFESIVVNHRDSFPEAVIQRAEQKLEM